MTESLGEVTLVEALGSPTLYRCLAHPVPSDGAGPPDTILTRQIETIDADCTPLFLPGAGVPLK
jgi:hypothetical protein